MCTLLSFAKRGQLGHLLKLPGPLSFSRWLSVSLKPASVQRAPGFYVESLEYRIHVETVGIGPRAVVLLPGAIGSTRTDFAPQLENLDRKLFTLVAWDPPGYGFSRPPERTFPGDFYHRDARVVDEVMHKLGHKKYSVVGWSDGGVTGLVLAATRPDRVEKLVALGANAYVTEHDVELLEATRDIDKWSEKMRAPLEAMYGRERFRILWSDYCDFYRDLVRKYSGEVCRNELSRIRCPTLIVHGGKDPLVPAYHPQYLLQHIAKAKLYLVPEGKHNLHLKYADEFNKVVTTFLVS